MYGDILSVLAALALCLAFSGSALTATIGQYPYLGHNTSAWNLPEYQKPEPAPKQWSNDALQMQGTPPAVWPEPGKPVILCYDPKGWYPGKCR